MHEKEYVENLIAFELRPFKVYKTFVIFILLGKKLYFFIVSEM